MPVPPFARRQLARAPVVNDNGGIDKAVFNEFCANMLVSRQNLLQSMIDPRRNVDHECGYPDTNSITPYQYRELYDRESIATRVVQVLPNECWQLQPQVYEDENSENITLFEQVWDDLGKTLRGKSFYQDEAANPIWEMLKRVDILSGIGSFGILLLGLDDGKALREPIDGFQQEDGAINLGTDAQYYVNNYISIQKDEVDEDDEGMLKHPGRPDPEDANPEVEDENAKRLSMKGNEDPNADPNMDPNADPNDPSQDPLGMEKIQKEGPQQMEPHPQNLEWQKTKRKLLYLRAFDESLVQITRYESRKNHPRYGLPVMYRVTFNDPSNQGEGIGLPTGTEDVHWSRIIHVADNLGSSEVMGVPRMRPVFNRLADLRKLYGGSAEMYWRGAFPGLAFETHPQLGSEIKIDHVGLKAQVEDYMNTLQRYIAAEGVSVNSISPQVVDPTPHIEGQITAVCIMIGVPSRIFMGSEAGNLASGQDDGTWNGRLKERQTNYITPRLIIPFIDRLIQAKVLPEPTGYSVIWPDLDSATPLDKANIANTRTTAMTAYLSGGGENMMTPKDFLIRILNFNETEAEEILNATLEHMAEVNPAADPNAMVPGHAPPKATTTFDEEGNPIQIPGGLPGDKMQPGDAGGGKPPFGKGKPGESEDPEGQEAGNKKSGVFGRNPQAAGQKPKGKPPQFSQNSRALTDEEFIELINNALPYVPPKAQGGRWADQGKGQSRAQRAAKREARRLRAASDIAGRYTRDTTGSGRLRDPHGRFGKEREEETAYKVAPSLRPEEYYKKSQVMEMGHRTPLGKKFLKAEMQRSGTVGALQVADVSVNEVSRLTAAAIQAALDKYNGVVPIDQRSRWQRAKDQAKRTGLALARAGGSIAREAVTTVVRAYVAKATGQAIERVTGWKVGPPPSELFNITPHQDENLDEWYEREMAKRGRAKYNVDPADIQEEVYEQIARTTRDNQIRAEAQRRRQQIAAKSAATKKQRKAQSIDRTGKPKRPSGGGYWSGSAANAANTSMEDQFTLAALRAQILADL